jgi:DNA-binding Lrp family transcriptional regulator
MAAAREGLDSRDLRILATLQEEARITNAALALRVGLSPSPCLERVRRLERDGYIRRYGAVLALERIASFVVVLAEVTLARHRGDDFQRFEQHIGRVPEVLEAHLVSGACDYLLKVIAHDMEAYRAVSDGLLEGPVAIERLASHVVLRSPKNDAVLPLDRLVDTRNP